MSDRQEDDSTTYIAQKGQMSVCLIDRRQTTAQRTVSAKAEECLSDRQEDDSTTDIAQKSIAVKSYVFSESLTDFRQFSSLTAYGTDLTYFREKMTK